MGMTTGIARNAHILRFWHVMIIFYNFIYLLVSKNFFHFL